MKKTIEIKLGSKGITDLAKQVSDLRSKLTEASENIIDDLSKIALEEMQKNYNDFDYKSSNDMSFEITGNRTSKKVSMIGPQAIYTEFGTGTKGGLNPHPQKNEFGLNPYNSGETIRTATQSVQENHGIPEGTLYWTYRNEDGETIYTQGIPAGKQVYNAAKTVRKKSKKIIQKRIDEVLK